MGRVEGLWGMGERWLFSEFAMNFCSVSVLFHSDFSKMFDADMRLERAACVFGSGPLVRRW